MCMRNTAEGCILLEQQEEMNKKVSSLNERMAKVESKQWVLIGLACILIGVLSLITFKLLDFQILLFSGEKGLRAVSQEARGDIHTIRKVVK